MKYLPKGRFPIAPDRTLRRAYFERPFLTYSSQLAHPIVASRDGSCIKNNNRWVWLFVSLQESSVLDHFSQNNRIYSTLMVDPKGQVWKRVWISEAGVNGCRKWQFLVWNRIRILENRWHSPTKNSQEYPPSPGLSRPLTGQKTTVNH